MANNSNLLTALKTMSGNPNADDEVQGAVVNELDGRILVVSINHPPVNALSVPVREGLLSAISYADGDTGIDAVVIRGCGRVFCSGADIREFGKPVSLWTRDVAERIESCSKVVVAAIHGVALGGGLEVALAADYRIATPTARVGLPEVSLGLLPGGGGTQRLSRLVGARAALDIMLSARHVSSAEAIGLGLLDRVADNEDILAQSLTYVRALLSSGARKRRAADAHGLRDQDAALAEVASVRVDMARKNRGFFAPRMIMDAVEAAITLPFSEGIKKEKEFFQACLESPQRSALVHAFFAEKEVVKVPEARRARPIHINHVGVIGGGTMGAGIAISLLDSGLSVTMVERDDEALTRGRKHVEAVYASLVKRNRLSLDVVNDRLSRFKGCVSYQGLAEVQFVIEAVFEDMEVKRAVFSELTRVCQPGTVLATNTSYLDVNVLAASTPCPEKVIGLHFFSPANIMKLAEVVVPDCASDETVATAFELSRRLKKIPVRAGVCDGFIGNRLLAVYRSAADYMMLDGASPYQIDAAIREFGFPMGPYQVMDLAGGDIAWAARKRRAATRDPRTRYVEVADRLCERGWFGQKSRRGFYLYADGDRMGKPDPDVEKIIEEERARAGVTTRTFTDEEIIRRYLAAMVSEATRTIEDGIALRPLDIDVMLLHGYGFPRYRGGPMKYADDIGLGEMLKSIRQFNREDDFFWRPPALLESLVDEGKDFESLNR